MGGAEKEARIFDSLVLEFGIRGRFFPQEKEKKALGGRIRNDLKFRRKSKN
jgi:hypothetical protein